MKKPSKAELQTRIEELSRDNAVLGTALNCVMEKETIPVGKKHHYTVSVCRPCDAHGGIVLVRFSPPGQKPYTAAYYFETWFSYWEHYPLAPNDEESLAIRDLAYEARRIVNQAQRELVKGE